MEAMRSEKIDSLLAALSKATGMIQDPKRTAVNPYYNSKYATLQDVYESIRQPLQESGLVVVQVTKCENGNIKLITTLYHIETGEFISAEYPIQPSDMRNPQSLGSAITYARRYSLCTILGLAPEDDDGNSAIPEKPPLQGPREKPITAPEQTNEYKQQKTTPKPNLETPNVESMIAEVEQIKSADELVSWWKDNTKIIGMLDPESKKKLTAAFSKHKNNISRGEWQ